MPGSSRQLHSPLLCASRKRQRRTFLIALTPCESAGKGQGERFSAPSVKTSRKRQRRTFLTALAPCGSGGKGQGEGFSASSPAAHSFHWIASNHLPGHGPSSPTGYDQILPERSDAGTTTNKEGGAADDTYKAYLQGFAIAAEVVVSDVSATTPDQEVITYVKDTLGSVRVLQTVDLLTGTITSTQHVDYDAYGDVVQEAGGANFGFQGESYEKLTKLADHRARFYDTRTGRWASYDSFEADPSNPQYLHKYVFGNVNPIYYTDPSGENALLLSRQYSNYLKGGIAAAGFVLLVLLPWLRVDRDDSALPNWGDGVGDIMYSSHSIIISFPNRTGDANAVANEMYSDLRNFRFFNNPVATVKTGNQAAYFNTEGRMGFASDYINPSVVKVGIASDHAKREISGVTMGDHMLVGVRKWDVEILSSSPMTFRIRTHAMEQPNGYLNKFGADHIGTDEQAKVWRLYLEQIGNRWKKDGANVGNVVHFPHTAVYGIDENPWRAELPARLR